MIVARCYWAKKMRRRLLLRLSSTREVATNGRDSTGVKGKRKFITSGSWCEALLQLTFFPFILFLLVSVSEWIKGVQVSEICKCAANWGDNAFFRDCISQLWLFVRVVRWSMIVSFLLDCDVSFFSWNVMWMWARCIISKLSARYRAIKLRKYYLCDFCENQVQVCKECLQFCNLGECMLDGIRTYER